MKLEDGVAPLELAREMKTLGFPQETLFAWYAVAGGIVAPRDRSLARENWFSARPNTEVPSAAACAAPTVAEMGEWLPTEINGHYLEVAHALTGWSYYYANDGGDGLRSVLPCTRSQSDAMAFTEAEARARLLIALAKDGAIDVRGLR